MRSYREVVNDKRRSLRDAKARKINEQKELLLNRMLRDRHVDSAYELNEAHRRSLKAGLLSMWSPATGLNKRGYGYIFESEIPNLTGESTPEEMTGWIAKVMSSKENLTALSGACTELMFNDNDNKLIAIVDQLVTRLVTMTRKPIDGAKVFPVMIKAYNDALAKAIEDVKFNVVKPEDIDKGEEKE